jgi:asparagine synthetase B (glutamine-hydrolysing)
MVDPVTGQFIVFNGEIYSYQSLRAAQMLIRWCQRHGVSR